MLEYCFNILNTQLFGLLINYDHHFKKSLFANDHRLLVLRKTTNKMWILCGPSNNSKAYYTCIKRVKWGQRAKEKERKTAAFWFIWQLFVNNTPSPVLSFMPSLLLIPLSNWTIDVVNSRFSSHKHLWNIWHKTKNIAIFFQLSFLMTKSMKSEWPRAWMQNCCRRTGIFRRRQSQEKGV